MQKNLNGTYMLTYAEQDGGHYETETFNHLQHAIVRWLSVEEKYLNFTAAINFDYQDVDGQLHEVCEYSTHNGFEFMTVWLPLPEDED